MRGPWSAPSLPTSPAAEPTSPYEAQLIRRFAMAEGKDRRFAEKRNPITPA